MNLSEFMEISSFLQAPPTMALRLSYLKNIESKNELIKKYFYQLKEEKDESVSWSLLDFVFNEVHRLKGSGGTYGFNEISIVYEEIMELIRPFHVKKKHPDLPSIDYRSTINSNDVIDQYLNLLNTNSE